MAASSVPFVESDELNGDLKCANTARTLPGYPQIFLNNIPELYSFLSEELCTPTLEKMAPRLWWMSKQSSAHISPLHYQAVRMRRIVITENPELHLIWYNDMIYIKPLPKYLLSHAFWTTYLSPSPSPPSPSRQLLHRSALGFIRTYRHLIQYESDFHIAREARLIPPTATWETFSAFTVNLKSIADADVTQRYHYGQIRLSRLNFYIKILLGRRSFHKVHGQYNAYFARWYGPLLFVFGMISLLLNALQVEMTVEPLVAAQWPRVWLLARYLGVLFAAFVSFVLVVLGTLLVTKVATEWYFAFRDRDRKMRRLKEKNLRRAGTV